MDKNISEKIKDEINELVKYGEEISISASTSNRGLDHDYIIRTSTWVTKIGQIIRNLCPNDSQYFKNYNDVLETENFYNMHSNWHRHISVMNGVIKAIQDDYEKGLLVNIRQLLKAEIFTDFLEMGEYLLNENYKDAAAVIIGAVLEDALRKLATENGVSTKSSNGKNLTLEPLNIELAKNNVYDKLIQKQITSWGDIRNNAAHGHYNKYDEDHVKMMLLFVQKFCSDYLK